jgi:hypothetical protein
MSALDGTIVFMLFSEPVLRNRFELRGAAWHLILYATAAMSNKKYGYCRARHTSDA